MLNRHERNESQISHRILFWKDPRLINLFNNIYIEYEIGVTDWVELRRNALRP